MIRRVHFRKAVGAGIAGAAAWEFVLRLLIAIGLPLSDPVRLLGTMVAGDTGPLRWWPAGMALHAAVGAIWAIFYAYFFWSTFDWNPPLQGLVFSLGPAVLSGLIMIPQIGYMHPLIQQGQLPFPGVFACRYGWGGPAGDLIGHLTYGFVLGALYRRPVGYPAWVTKVPHG
jgi:hypothetical protein